MATQYRTWSPHLFAQNFQTPMLVLHGELDFRVPYTESLSLFTALQRQGVPSRLDHLPRRRALDPQAAEQDPLVDRGPRLARALAHAARGLIACGGSGVHRWKRLPPSVPRAHPSIRRQEGS